MLKGTNYLPCNQTDREKQITKLDNSNMKQIQKLIQNFTKLGKNLYSIFTKPNRN